LELERYYVAVPEGGSTAVGVRLSNSPLENQDVAVYAQRESGDSSISVISAHPFFFDDSNWDVFQYVVVAAAEDPDVTNGSASISVHTVVDVGGEEPIFVEASLGATEIDNDWFDQPNRIDFLVDKSRVGVAEGGHATFGVKLSGPPPSTLTATVTRPSGDADITVQSPARLVFNSGNWDTYQTVTLAARADPDDAHGTAIIEIAARGWNIEDAHVLAVEAEAGHEGDVLLAFTFRSWSSDGSVWERANGIIPVTLDPDSVSILGSATGIGRNGTPSGFYSGTAYLNVRNFFQDQFCYCPPPRYCFERNSPGDLALEIILRFEFRAGEYTFPVFLPRGGGTFVLPGVSCAAGSSHTFVEVDLFPG
jgi:hypothetical protein